MSDIIKSGEISENQPLFDRVVAILENARANVVRSVNSNMVAAYWLIGHEIVHEIQDGEARAGYGKRVVENLSRQLTERYGKGFSEQSLQNYRRFYLVYSDRTQIPSRSGRILSDYQIPSTNGRELVNTEKGHLSGDEFVDDRNSIPHPTGGEFTEVIQKRYKACSELVPKFNPNLRWSHYRALMRVENPQARAFYEKEAAECGWKVPDLERQIKTGYFERIIDNRGEEGLISTERERLQVQPVSPEQIIKSPYVLEFLGLSDSPNLHESLLEQVIVDNLQKFLLELGKGFSFVARQKHIRFDDDDFYVDLVFYNYILKCFVLIDLKLGKLTHQDVGQMDGYVRLYEDQFKIEGDNPTIGLILCSDKSEAVAKYSVLSENRQIFASKYLQFLPSEEELKLQIERERRLIENRRAEIEGGEK